jgi:hypothetical protein
MHVHVFGSGPRPTVLDGYPHIRPSEPAPDPKLPQGRSDAGIGDQFKGLQNDCAHIQLSRILVKCIGHYTLYGVRILSTHREGSLPAARVSNASTPMPSRMIPRLPTCTVTYSGNLR